MICTMCLGSMHSLCLSTSCDCNQRSHVYQDTDPSPTNNGDNDADHAIRDDDDETRDSLNSRRSSGTRRYKRDATLKDQQSTGRKRAAREYPLDREKECEWRGKSNCGGGLRPILGCLTGLQQARHHGPDKSTSNNDEGNVHRICHYCHNRWHTANNDEYDWNETRVKPHRPVPMTDADKQEAMIMQMTSRSKSFNPIKD